MSNEKISSVTKSSLSQPPSLLYNNARIKPIFSRDFLKQDKVTHNHEPIVNIYIVYRLSPVVINTSSVTPENCLFGAVKLTKNDDIDKYKYSGYGTGFDSRGTFNIQAEGLAKMLLFLELI